MTILKWRLKSKLTSGQNRIKDEEAIRDAKWLRQSILDFRICST